MNNTIKFIETKIFLDRVRCSEWVKKLVGLPDDNLEMAKIRNEYIQFLRIQVRNKFLHGPFTELPPANDLCPFSEFIGNMLAEQVNYYLFQKQQI